MFNDNLMKLIYELTPQSYDLKSDYSALVNLFDDQIRKLLEGKACFHVNLF